MKTTKIIVLLLLLICTTSCMFDGFGIRGNGNVVSEDRKVSAEFDAIKVSQGIHVTLIQGNNVDINVEADENIIDLLVTEVEGDVLKIYFDKNVSRAKAKNVYLTVTKLNMIKTSSGAHVKTKGTIEAKTMALNSSSGSGINANLDAQSISCSTSSGSNVELSGETQSFKGNSSSGSHINASDLESETSNVDVSSGAGINVNVSEELTAHASSGGNIRYEGNPTVLNKSKSSGGSISKR